MKHSHLILYVAALLLTAACAKTVSQGPNEDEKRFFEAWMKLNHPDAERSGRGIYIISETVGSGAEVKKDGYLLADYTIRDLDSNIILYTGKNAAKQMGDYDTTKYYGPKFLTTFKESMRAGLLDAVVGMKAGGSRTVIIPSWLMAYSEMETEQEYLDAENSNTSSIYEITVADFAESANDWQNDSIVRFFKNDNVKIFGKPASSVFTTEAGTTMTMADTLERGFFYKKISQRAQADTAAFKADTTIFINYTGKLLNGLVFDTNIEKVAKDNGLYSRTRSYDPVMINWAESADKITMGSDDSSIISGFGKTLWQMREFEKGVGVFYSPLGYGYSGSGDAIPAYASLIFEIEIVEKPE